MIEQKRVKLLSPEVARKIAAGEVIDKPLSIVRELMDNAIDSGASRIRVEIFGGGIEKIRVIDNGCGMTKEDLLECARPHATSKISSENDLLHLTTLGFRGEALSSMAAVSNLEITSGGYKMKASITEDHILTQVAQTLGTIVQTTGLFENFPARRQFLKRPASEGIQCKNMFEEKVLARPDIAFSFFCDGEEKISLPENQTLKERFVQTLNLFKSENLFYEIKHENKEQKFSFTLIIGEPSVTRTSRKDIYIYVNGRRIQEYSLVQAIVYGSQGYFPNGTFPVACLFIQIDSSLVDFNIHPAKREARFQDLNVVHHAVSSETRNFFKQYTVKSMILENDKNLDYQISSTEFSFTNEKTESNFVEEPFEQQTKSFYPNIKQTTKSYNHLSRESFFSKPKTESNLNELKHNYLPEKNESIPYKNDFHYIGCALGTFIIAEKNETLYIIDQHAAHERIIYNSLMTEAGQKQPLLVPFIVQTDSIADDNYIRAIQKKLEEAGYTCNDCGNGKWEFITVPIRWKGTEADLKKDVLDRRVSPTDIINATVASTACRSAVMDGTVLDDETAKVIAKGALELPDPHCPHGRPVWTAITRKQLFSLVKRT